MIWNIFFCCVLFSYFCISVMGLLYLFIYVFLVELVDGETITESSILITILNF